MPLLSDRGAAMTAGPRVPVGDPLTSLRGTDPGEQPPYLRPNTSLQTQLDDDASSTSPPPQAPSPPQPGTYPFWPPLDLGGVNDYGTSVYSYSQPDQSLSLTSDRSHASFSPNSPQSPGPPASSPASDSLDEAPTPAPFFPFGGGSFTRGPRSPDAESEISFSSEDAPTMPSISNNQARSFSSFVEECHASSMSKAVSTGAHMPIGRLRLQGWVGSAPRDTLMMTSPEDGALTGTLAPPGSWLDGCMSEINTDERMKRRWVEQMTEFFDAAYATFDLHEIGRQIPGTRAVRASHTSQQRFLQNYPRRRVTASSARQVETEPDRVAPASTGDNRTGVQATWSFENVGSDDGSDPTYTALSVNFRHLGTGDSTTAVFLQDDMPTRGGREQSSQMTAVE